MSKLISGNFDNLPPTQTEQRQQLAKLIEMLKNSTPLKCDSCGEENFIEVLRIRKISGLINGTGREMIVPIPVYACASCGHVNEYFAKNSGLPMEEQLDTKPPETTEENTPPFNGTYNPNGNTANDSVTER